MNKLNEIVSKALEIGGLVEVENLTVEANGFIVFYFINEEECTANQALEYLESL